MNQFAGREERALEWNGARVVVLGLARSGVAAASALVARGASVTVLDAADTDALRARAETLQGARAVLGASDGDLPTTTQVIVASPGIAPSSGWLRAAETNGIPVWSEIELAYRLGVRPAIAITGTNGKTTTTEMAVAALAAAGYDAEAAGNIGAPLVDARAEMIVAEVSSFQLHNIVSFRAPVAVLLNIAPDHLDWHGSMEAYARAKGRIFEDQTTDDVAVYLDDELCEKQVAWGRARQVPFSPVRRPDAGAGVEDGWIVVPEGRVVEVERLRARQSAFVADAVAAAAATCALGADPARVGAALASYELKPHRIERVAEIDGVTFINDSKASDPHATLAALSELRDVVLIAGGRNKGIDLGELRAGASHLRGVVAIGESADDIVRAFATVDVPVERASGIGEAVRIAAARARAGDTVLLSPACASWDMFTSYEERGEAFREAVRDLGGENA